MKLAAQLYTVREYTKNEDDIYKTLKRVKEIGYDAVQISAFGEYKPENLKTMLGRLGLTVCATHTPYERIVNETQSVIREHRLLGIKYVGLGYFAGKTIEDYKRLSETLAPAADAFFAAGLKLLYHNHAHEFARLDGVRPLDYLRDNTDPDKFGFLPDFYWIQTAGLSPLKFIEDYAGRIPVVHFKDMRVSAVGGATNMAEIFEGNMDYDGIYAACAASGAEWAAVEQDNCDGDPFVSLEKSFVNIKKRGMFP
jgi:sugar phosphate isomerase/epimerase